MALAQNAAKKLHVFADGARTGEHHGDIGLGYIDAFVEYLGGDQAQIFALVKGFEDVFALF